MNYCLIISKNSEYILNEKNYNVYTCEDIHELDTTQKLQVIWEACDENFESNSSRLRINNDESISVNIEFSPFEKVITVLENCCLIEEIKIVTTSENKPILTKWVTAMNVPFQFIDANQFRVYFDDKLPNVYSSLLWKKRSEYIAHSKMIKNINITFTADGTYWDKIDKRYIKNLKQYWNDLGKTIFSINAPFYNIQANIFNSYNEYIVQFKRVIEYAYLLGAKYIIYGSSSSKFLQYKTINKYESYQKAHVIFMNTMKQLGDYAKMFDITIIVKPNTTGNYILQEDHAEDIVNAINHENIIAGKKRGFVCTSFRDFNLFEAELNEKLFIYKFT